MAGIFLLCVVYLICNSSFVKTETHVPKFCPNVIIVGVRKGGTTSMRQYLEFHPSLCFPDTEVSQLSKDVIPWGEYRMYFSGCLQQQHQSNSSKFLLGEHSPGYLKAKVSSVLKKYCPQTKAIILLRNPVDKVYSYWWMDLCKSRHNISFAEYIKSKTKGDVMSSAYYYDQVANWLKNFPLSKNQVFIVKSETFFAETRQVLEDIQRFLDIPFYNYKPEELATFGSGPLCVKRLGERPKMDPIIRKSLENKFRSDVTKLEKLLQRDFNWF